MCNCNDIVVLSIVFCVGWLADGRNVNGNKIKPINGRRLRDREGNIVSKVDGVVIKQELEFWETLMECESWLNPENRHMMKELRITAKRMRRGHLFRKFIIGKLKLKWVQDRLVRLVIKWIHIHALLAKNDLLDPLYLQHSEYIRQLFKIMQHLFHIDEIDFAAKFGRSKEAWLQLDKRGIDGGHLASIIEIGQAAYAQEEAAMREQRRADRQHELDCHHRRVRQHAQAGNVTPYDDSDSGDYAVFKSDTPSQSPFYSTMAEFSDSDDAGKEKKNANGENSKVNMD